MSNNIAFLRDNQKISLRELSNRTGIAYPTICRIEQGRDPMWSTVNKLANFFNVSADYLMGRDSTKIIMEKGEFTSEEIELACRLIREIRKGVQDTPQISED
jgi:transcriptional regulator with XRE-family HTH domain